MVTIADRQNQALRIVEAIPDPEMPYVTLGDLGIVTRVALDGDGMLVVEVTPTYAACPAMAEIKYTIDRQLRAAGFGDIELRTVLDPPWTTDSITPEGRRKLRDAGVAPPNPVSGPDPAVSSAAGVAVLLARSSAGTSVACPRCGSSKTEMLSRFSGTACKSLHRCLVCTEPFEHIRTI